MQIPPVGSLGAACLLIIVAAALTGMASVCLGEFGRHARWHDLRVRCQRMRRERLMAMLEVQTRQDERAQRASDIARIGAASLAGPGETDEGEPGDHGDVAGRIGAEEPRGRRAA